MSAGAVVPRCDRCGSKTYDLRHNRVLGRWYCTTCDAYITKPSKKLEEAYNRRVAERRAKEARA